MCIFHLNFLNVWGILAQKIYNECAIFYSILWHSRMEQSQPPSLLGQLIFHELQHTGISHLKNFIFQWICLSNATLLSMVFFACDVHKLNYIKNDFVYCVSSNKRQASNKHHPLISTALLGAHINEISASPLITAASLNVALIRIFTIFYK